MAYSSSRDRRSCREDRLALLDWTTACCCWLGKLPLKNRLLPEAVELPRLLSPALHRTNTFTLFLRSPNTVRLFCSVFTFYTYKQCDQSLKSEIRPIFAKNSHIYSPDFQPPFFSAPFSAPVINVHFLRDFYLICAIILPQMFDISDIRIT